MLLYEFQLFALSFLPQHCQFIVIQGKEFILQDGEIHLFSELQLSTVTVLLEVDVGHEVVEEPEVAVVERICQGDQRNGREGPTKGTCSDEIIRTIEEIPILSIADILRKDFILPSEDPQKLHVLQFNIFLRLLQVSHNTSMLELIGCPIRPTTSIITRADGKIRMVETLFPFEHLIHDIHDQNLQD